MSFGIVLMIRADMGVSPWDVFHIGLFLQLGLTIGTWTIIIGIFIIALASFLTRSLPQAGAIVNMLLVGVFIDLFMLIPWLQTPSLLWGKILLFSVGMIINGVGIGVYIAPKCGAGPRDSLMLVLTEKTKWKVQWIRGGMELVVLTLGWLLGGPVSIGTLIYTFGIGSIVGITLPLSDAFFQRLTGGSGSSQSGGVQNESINKGQIRAYHHDGASH